MSELEQITQADLDWLRTARDGSRLARHDETGMLGHVYRGRTTPDGWTDVIVWDSTLYGPPPDPWVVTAGG